MKYFFTSDNHWSHRRIIEYCNRPFKTSEEMDEIMIENWNRVVGPDDVVFHLGDVIFERDVSKINGLLSRLNGEKHLIFGNHDKMLRNALWRKHFKSSSELSTIWVPPEANNGVGQQIVLCHYAMKTWNCSHHKAWSLYGHSHGTMPDDPHMLSCDVGVDCWDFTLVSMEQLNTKMATKTFYPVDGHKGKYEDNQNT